MSIADNKLMWRSFAGGELAPELYGRIDLDRYQTGLAKSLNFMVLPHGPVTTRGGTKYVLHSKFSAKQSRLIPFIRANNQAFVIELGDGYMRFHSVTGTVLEAEKTITGITQASVGVVTAVAHGYANGDTVYLKDIVGMTELNGRFVLVANKTTDTFEIQSLDGVNINTSGFTAYSSGGTAEKVYEVTTTYDADATDLLEIQYAQDTDTLTLVHYDYGTAELVRTGVDTYTLTTPIDFDPPLAGPTLVVTTPVASGTPVSRYRATSVDADGIEGFVGGVQSATNDLTVAGNYNLVSVNVAVTDAVRYNIYKEHLGSGKYYFIGTIVGTTGGIEDRNIDWDFTKAPPETFNDFDAGASTRPSTVAYFEQRRFFGATDNEPQTVWGTNSGFPSLFTRGLPPQDDDAIKFRLAALQANRVKHIVPINDLIVLTSGAAWRVSSVGGEGLTPASISAKPQAAVGSANARPVNTGDAVLYVASRGHHLNEIRYSDASAAYVKGDLSLLAPHLIDGFTFIDTAWTISPYPMWWGVRGDGQLISMTYVPEQKVIAWHQHNLAGGAVEAIAAIPGGETTDTIFCVVKRTINGNIVRYIERFNTAAFGSVSEFADQTGTGQTGGGSAGGEEGWVVNLDGHTIYHTSLSSAQAYVFVRSDGTVDQQKGVTVTQIDASTDWIIPNSAAPSDFEVRCTVLALTGSLAGDSHATNTWLPMTSDHKWGVVKFSDGYAEATLKLEIRDASTGVIEGTGTYIVQAENYDSE